MSTSHDHGVLPPSRLEEVAEGVFAYIQPDGSWMINNTGFLPAKDGVTAIDACSTELKARGLEALHRIADLGEGKRLASFRDADGNIFRLIDLGF